MTTLTILWHRAALARRSGKDRLGIPRAYLPRAHGSAEGLPVFGTARPVSQRLTRRPIDFILEPRCVSKSPPSKAYIALDFHDNKMPAISNAIVARDAMGHLAKRENW